MTMREYTYNRQKKDFEEAKPPAQAQREQQSDILGARASTQSQAQCSLLSILPAEIRMLIFEYAIGSQRVHIICKHRKLGHAVCDEEYWNEHRSEMPGLRSSSYMYTFGSLPATKQLADWNMCNLLMTCRQIYFEAVPVLYETNTFTFWDLRVIQIFKDNVLPQHWERIRTIDVYAMFYRNDDMNDACEARSRLQLDAWSLACSAIASLPSLRKVRVIVSNPRYLDREYLNGGRRNAPLAVLGFLLRAQTVPLRERGTMEVWLPVKGSGVRGEDSHWDIVPIESDTIRKALAEEMIVREYVHHQWPAIDGSI